MKNVVIFCALAAGFGLGGPGCSPGEKTVPGPPPFEKSIPGENGGIDLIGMGMAGYEPFLKEDSPVTEAGDAFRTQDGMLHITGKGWGYLRTKEEFENYRLVVEYKWGEYTADLRDNRARDAGIFVHASSKDGAFRNAWPSSFEAQMVEGRAGDVIVIAALDPETGEKAPHQLNSRAREIRIPDAASDFEHDPEADPFKLPPPRFERARIFRHPRNVEWKDEKGYRSPNPIEKPAGEWNRMVVVCEGDTLKIVLNDQTVNVARKVTPTKGHICIQSEMSECWIRKLKLTPIEEKPEP